jgi:O-glycosyl hydrolase
MTWAQRIQSALTTTDVNAFFYWWGASASTANSGLVRLTGDTVTPSKRLWAFAAFSRFIRPGAVRVDATSDSSGVTASSFRNRDGSVVTELLNSGTTPVTETVRMNDVRGHVVASYLTDDTHDVAAGQPIRAHGNTFTTVVPARSLVTLVEGGR